MDHINWTLGVVLPYINFFTFLIAAFFLFKKPLMQAAKRAREAFDVTSLEAKRAKELVTKQLQEIKRRSDNLDKELEDMKKVAEISTRREESNLVEEGERLARHIREEAKRIIEAEIEKVRASIGTEIIDLVKKEVVERIKNEVGPDRHHQIIKDRTRELSNIKQ